MSQGRASERAGEPIEPSFFFDRSPDNALELAVRGEDERRRDGQTLQIHERGDLSSILSRLTIGGDEVSREVRRPLISDRLSPLNVAGRVSAHEDDSAPLALVHGLQGRQLCDAGRAVARPEVDPEIAFARERDGLDYGGADASFELLARKSLGTLPNFFRLDSFRVIDERRIDPRGNLVTLSEASVRVQVGQNRHMMVAEGAGPVHALDVALRKALADVYPALDDLRLIDYKVRILNSEGGTKARIRVMIDSTDGVDNWSTVGVSDNVIDASYSALHDGIVYKLLRDDLKRQANGGN